MVPAFPGWFVAGFVPPNGELKPVPVVVPGRELFVPPENGEFGLFNGEFELFNGEFGLLNGFVDIGLDEFGFPVFGFPEVFGFPCVLLLPPNVCVFPNSDWLLMFCVKVLEPVRLPSGLRMISRKSFPVIGSSYFRRKNRSPFVERSWSMEEG